MKTIAFLAAFSVFALTSEGSWAAQNVLHTVSETTVVGSQHISKSKSRTITAADAKSQHSVVFTPTQGVQEYCKTRQDTKSGTIQKECFRYSVETIRTDYSMSSRSDSKASQATASTQDVKEMNALK